MTTTRVWLVKCLCGQRHCLVLKCLQCASSIDAATILEDMRREIRAQLDFGSRAPQCPHCASPDSTWDYEAIPTAYATLFDAVDHWDTLQPVLSDPEEPPITTKGPL
jgi:hypothetical protein